MRHYVVRVELEPESFLRSGVDPEGALVEAIEGLGPELGLKIEAGMIGPNAEGQPVIEVATDILG